MSQKTGYILSDVLIAVARFGNLPGLMIATAGCCTVIYLLKYLSVRTSLKTQVPLPSKTHTGNRAEEKFKGLLESLHDAMIISDKEGKIVMTNLQTEMLFDYTRQELMDMPIAQLIPLEDWRRYLNAPDHAPSAVQRPFDLGKEHLGFKKDHTPVPIEIRLFLLQDETGPMLSICIRDITEKKAREAKLDLARADYQLMVGSVKDYAIFLLDQRGCVATWNSGAERIKGYHAEEIIGKPIDIFYTEEELKNGEPQRNLDTALAQGHFETEGWRVRKDGSVFYASVDFTTLMDGNGQLYGFAKVTKDITERKKDEERIRFLAGIANSIQDPIISTDSNYRIKDWNTAAEQLFEWRKDEAIGHTSHDLLKVGYPNESRDKILNLLELNGTWRGEVVYHTRSGKPVHALATVSYLKDGTHNVTGLLIVVRDITIRKEAETALSRINSQLEIMVRERTEEIQRNERKYRHLFENNPLPLFVMDLKTFQNLDVNEMALQQYGYSREEFLSMTALDMSPEKDKDAFTVKNYSLDLRSKDNNKGVWLHRKKSGDVMYVEIIAHEILFEGTEAALVLSIDFTEKKKAQELIGKLHAELEQKVLERTAELETAKNEMESFTYSVSHDLRGPLRGIIGFTMILEEEYAVKLDAEAKRLCGVIKNNARRMGQLIDDLLEFSRLGKQELLKTTVQTQEMLEEILQELQDTSTSPQQTTWNIGTLIPMHADSSTIRQVWTNLLSNAIKYSARKETPIIEIGCYQGDDHTVYYVKDNGVGFNQQYAPKLFKVFQRLHHSDEFEGTGIGLALVHKIVTKHGGKVWGEGQENEGSRFSFWLP